jgi:hypothetical protein
MLNRLTLVVGSAIVVVAATGAMSNGPGRNAVDVLLCDGATKVQIAALPTTREGGQAVASGLMTQWLAKNPGRAWDMTAAAAGIAADDPKKTPDEIIEKRHKIEPVFDNSYLLAEGQGDAHAYGSWSQRDIDLWAIETRKFVVDGARTFHDAKLLGSTIAVSCDMCHPDGANTHPETYPKFQVQLGKAVLLRDMINWCIEHPVRGTKLDADDPRMRAMEAYLHAQRRGKAFAYGKH